MELKDWGTYTSWIAAAIAVLTYSATLFRAWWNRPIADWAFTGKLNGPRPESDWLHVEEATVSNFGDGNAHRVSVWLQRAPAATPECIATIPVLKPGDTFELKKSMVRVDHVETAEVWVTWTPPPLRHRKPDTSTRHLLLEFLEVSQRSEVKLRTGLEFSS